MKMIRTPVKSAFVLTITVCVCFSAIMLSGSVLLLAFWLTETSASSGTNDRMGLTPSFDFQAALEARCVLTFHDGCFTGLSGEEAARWCPTRWYHFHQKCLAVYPVWSRWSTANVSKKPNTRWRSAAVTFWSVSLPVCVSLCALRQEEVLRLCTRQRTGSPSSGSWTAAHLCGSDGSRSHRWEPAVSLNLVASLFEVFVFQNRFFLFLFFILHQSGSWFWCDDDSSCDWTNQKGAASREEGSCKEMTPQSKN